MFFFSRCEAEVVPRSAAVFTSEYHKKHFPRIRKMTSTRTRSPLPSNADDDGRGDCTSFDSICRGLRDDSARITIAHLHNRGFGDAGAARLAAALRHNTRLVVLYLDGNQITAKGAAALFGSLRHHPSIRHVLASHNSFGDAGAASAASFVASSPSLRILKLAGCNIGDDGARALARALRDNSAGNNNGGTLEQLVLESNDIGLDGARCLARTGLANNAKLKVLDLRYNPRMFEVEQQPVGGTVYECFADVLEERNKTIEELRFEDVAAEADIEARHRLRHYLELNRLGRAKFGSRSLPATAWPRVLASASKSDITTTTADTTTVNRRYHLLYSVVQARPDLAVSGCSKKRKTNEHL